ncbi:adenosylcobinamide-phosphate synthase CbiB [Pelagibacterium sediminicola]|uniref:adenosylcobinamide-phosphate synthase CbiB n=1 Tax=Pelagibacterium sediminicola TaxID=2248761 RepID=UPI000E30F23B|nr:adenosylcobinamide-phosphate synthase CbiB [Pelagibacterium sediminicola]
MNLWVALIAMGCEWLFGYPQRLVAAIGHPVMWMGWLIDRLEARFNDPERDFATRRRGGMIALGVVLLAVLAASGAITVLLRSLPFGWIGEAVLASALLAHKGLHDAVLRVVAPLRAGDIAAAREAVSHIVGRDTSTLDEAGVARAAIETLAENASDGGIAPLFYLVLFGLPGAALYKAINTADSMIGHRSERYEAFGWAAARLDDLVNFLPARLTAGFLIVMARDKTIAFEAARRDARHHASPNAGWPEAAMAGALGIGLGGPRAYQGRMLDLAPMGRGRRDLGAEDIVRAIGLYKRALFAVWTLLGGASLVWWWLLAS